MTRYTDSRIAMRTAATTPAGIADRPSEGSSAGLVEIMLRPFRRAQIAHELRSLDDRMLKDIGITRADIDRVAAESAGGGDGIVVALVKHVVRKLAAWSARRDAYRRLMALDDRMLADIGISRAEIPALVKSMRGPARPALEGSFEAEVIRPLKQWSLWRDAHKQLNQLDNRMLSDIGLVRGDIDGVAEELASRATREPANTNSTAPQAA